MSLKIKFIIALMSAALLGLVFIQFYWIDNAITLKKDEFGRKVNLALRNVVTKLEKREAFEKFKQHQVGRKILHDKMMKKRAQMIRRRNQMMANSNAPGQPHVHSSKDGKWIHSHSEGKPVDGPRIFKRGMVQRNDDGSTIQIDINVQSDAKGGHVTEEVIAWSSDDPDFEFQLNNQVAVFDDIFLDLLNSEQYSNIDERLSSNLIDSVLKQELKEVMVLTDVEFGVLNNQGKDVEELSTNHVGKELLKSNYQARLFPNDLFSEPYYLSLVFPNQKGYLLQSMWMTLTTSTLFILLIIGAFWYTIHVIQNQKQLSIIKNDFINNMTHELKTPISTISLACEALNDESLASDNKTKGKFLSMISHENSRLATLVENVLRSSIWDKSAFELKFEKLDLHDLLNHVAQTAEIQLEKRLGKINLSLGAELSNISGDPIHLTSIFNNLVDNAIKYTKDNPEISIITKDSSEGIRIEVKDNGIGISREHQKKIFDKFYRIPTGNVHNVKGFGLGLNYVLNVVKNHGGHIEVQSHPGQGSNFIITLPIMNA